MYRECSQSLFPTLPAGSLVASPICAAQNGSVLGTMVEIKRCAGAAIPPAPEILGTASTCSALTGMSTLCTAQTGSVLGTMLEMNRWAGTAVSAEPGRWEPAAAPARCSTESVLPIRVFRIPGSLAYGWSIIYAYKYMYIYMCTNMCIFMFVCMSMYIPTYVCVVLCTWERVAGFLNTILPLKLKLESTLIFYWCLSSIDQ